MKRLHPLNNKRQLEKASTAIKDYCWNLYLINFLSLICQFQWPSSQIIPKGLKYFAQLIVKHVNHYPLTRNAAVLKGITPASSARESRPHSGKKKPPVLTVAIDLLIYRRQQLVGSNTGCQEIESLLSWYR